VYLLAVFWDHWVVVKMVLKVPTAGTIAKDRSWRTLDLDPRTERVYGG
jgi:hypothetical protein